MGMKQVALLPQQHLLLLQTLQLLAQQRPLVGCLFCLCVLLRMCAACVLLTVATHSSA